MKNSVEGAFVRKILIDREMGFVETSHTLQGCTCFGVKVKSTRNIVVIE